MCNTALLASNANETENDDIFQLHFFVEITPIFLYWSSLFPAEFFLFGATAAVLQGLYSSGRQVTAVQLLRDQPLVKRKGKPVVQQHSLHLQLAPKCCAPHRNLPSR